MLSSEASLVLEVLCSCSKATKTSLLILTLIVLAYLSTLCEATRADPTTKITTLTLTHRVAGTLAEAHPSSTCVAPHAKSTALTRLRLTTKATEWLWVLLALCIWLSKVLLVVARIAKALEPSSLT